MLSSVSFVPSRLPVNLEEQSQVLSIIVGNK